MSTNYLISYGGEYGAKSPTRSPLEERKIGSFQEPYAADDIAQETSARFSYPTLKLTQLTEGLKKCNKKNS